VILITKNYSTKILILLTFFSSALFSIITPMAKELTLALSLGSEEQIAVINSMFLVVAAFSSLIWAVLADKFQRKNLLIVATIEWSLFTLLTIFATDFYSLLIFQLFSSFRKSRKKIWCFKRSLCFRKWVRADVIRILNRFLLMAGTYFYYFDMRIFLYGDIISTYRTSKRGNG